MNEPPPLAAPPPAHLRARTSALAVFALVMACLFFMPFFPLIGLILGIIALVRARPNEPRGVAIAAVVVGPLSFFFLQAMCAAIAIPSFLKYVRRAKTSEASLNVRRLADAASAYYADNGRMPPPADWTPAGSACGSEHDRFAPDARVWQGSPWRELAFSIDAPHYYQYRVESLGAGRVAVEARGDLNCNGQFSSFRRTVGPEGAGQLETEHELE